MEIDVETTSGPVRGTREHNVCVFRGIPYARPPVNTLRFRPPEPPACWTEPRNATRAGPAAPQNPDPLDYIYGEVLAPGDEDCLTLNVWTPAADAARCPVMVCIHGGAFLIGSGRWPWYDGKELVRRGDVVLVTINYRLGVLGFLDLSELGGAEYATSGNHGLLDQVAALRWVRDNIDRFGGDSGNVTVFGESAGGISISCLMAMPAARGLFRRAIVMSGGANFVRFPGTSRTVAGAFRQTAGVRDVDGLRTLPTKALLKAQKRYLRRNEFGGDLVFGPVVDGSVLPAPPLHAIQAGCASDVALLTGTTRDEARLWSLYAPILRWARRIRTIGGLISVVAGVLFVLGWLAARQSLPMINGEMVVRGPKTAIYIDRDDRGIPTVRAADREDLAFGLGFVHGQDRFFQMDGLRRYAAGELSEIFGPGLERGMRRLGPQDPRPAVPVGGEASRRGPGGFGQAPARCLRGGGALGLGSLKARPFEYLLLQETPRPSGCRGQRACCPLALHRLAGRQHREGVDARGASRRPPRAAG